MKKTQDISSCVFCYLTYRVGIVFKSCLKFFKWEWLVEEISLSHIAGIVTEQLHLFTGLNTFCDTLKTHSLSHCNNVFEEYFLWSILSAVIWQQTLIKFKNIPWYVLDEVQ